MSPPRGCNANLIARFLQLRDIKPTPEEFLAKFDVAPLHAFASNDGVDVGLLAEHGEARLLNVVKEVGRIHPEIGWDAVRLDQELSDVDRVADPVLRMVEERVARDVSQTDCRCSHEVRTSQRTLYDVHSPAKKRRERIS